MGLFGKRESEEEIKVKIANSEMARVFANALCSRFQPDGEEYQWLRANIKERHCELAVDKEAVGIEKVEVNQQRYKQTGTYSVDTHWWGFGASGYENLPNGRYVSALREYLIMQIQQNCPDVAIGNNSIKLKSTVLKGW